MVTPLNKKKQLCQNLNKYNWPCIAEEDEINYAYVTITNKKTQIFLDGVKLTSSKAVQRNQIAHVLNLSQPLPLLLKTIGNQLDNNSINH